MKNLLNIILCLKNQNTIQKKAKRERERELKENLTWGEGFPTVENHSKALACKNPDCTLFGDFNPDRNSKNIVGLKKAPYTNGEGYEYAVFIECPECFEKFWYHSSEESAKEDYNKEMSEARREMI